MDVPYGGQRALLSSSRPLRAPSERIQKSPSKETGSLTDLNIISDENRNLTLQEQLPEETTVTTEDLTLSDLLQSANHGHLLVFVGLATVVAFVTILVPEIPLLASLMFVSVISMYLFYVLEL